MHGLSWPWIALAVTVPALAGFLLAWPLWVKSEPIFGNLVGTAVMFGSAVGFILRERVALTRTMLDCLDQGFTCFPDPGEFTRYAIYAFIALFQVIALFTISLKVEERVRRRGYAPEWR